jgi:hypothetical protein
VIILEKTIQPQGKEPVAESHFYISSLDPDTTSPAKFQQLILNPV